MTIHHKLLSLLLCLGTALLFSPPTAAAQPSNPEGDQIIDESDDYDGEIDYSAPPSDDDTSGGTPDLDPNPVVPGLDVGADAGLSRQSGTGGTIAYAEAGVFELGGGATLNFADKFTQVSIRPTVGWFLADNLQFSLIFELAYVGTEIESFNPTTGDSDTIESDVWTFGGFVEPSYHLPFTNRVLGFAGVGLGVNYNGASAGFAVRPRVGVDLLVGRSGIFRPSFDVSYSTVEIANVPGNEADLGVQVTYGLSFTYSVML